MKRLTKKKKCLPSSALESCGRAGSAFFVIRMGAVGRLAKNDEMYEFPPMSIGGRSLSLFPQFVYRLSTIKFLRDYFGQDFPVPQTMRTILILTKDTPATSRELW